MPGTPRKRSGTSLESASKPSPTATSDYSGDRASEALFTKAAIAEGLTYHEYCKKYGIVDASHERRLRRYEVNEADLNITRLFEYQSGKAPIHFKHLNPEDGDGASRATRNKHG